MPELPQAMPQEGTVRGSVLIVDDDGSSRKVLKMLLEQETFKTFTAADGTEGILLAKVEHPQVILLDVIMPKLDGYRVLKRLKDDPDTELIPVIMLTAKGADKDIRTSFQLGAVFHVEKPFEAADLLQKIQVALLRTKAA